MKFRTILALFVVVLAVFLRGGHAEETEESDDFEEKYLRYGARKVEDSEPYVFVFLIYKTNNDLFKRSVRDSCNIVFGLKQPIKSSICLFSIILKYQDNIKPLNNAQGQTSIES